MVIRFSATGIVLVDFGWAVSLHISPLTNGKKCIQITEYSWELSSTTSLTPSPYRQSCLNVAQWLYSAIWRSTTFQQTANHSIKSTTLNVVIFILYVTNATHSKSSQTIDKVPVNAQSCDSNPAVMDLVFHGHNHLSETPTSSTWLKRVYQSCHQNILTATSTHLNILVIYPKFAAKANTNRFVNYLLNHRQLKMTHVTPVIFMMPVS